MFERQCQHCHAAVATLRVLHDGKPIEAASLSCASCWALYQETLAEWLAAERPLFCDACRKDAGGDHLTAEPLQEREN